MDDVSSFSHKRLSTILKDPSHPHHSAAKAEMDRRKVQSEKTLTPAEIRKRDKIAKAIKKDDPDMPMDKKMAIATATAKRVAEVSSNTLSNYMRKSAADAGKPRQDARTQDKRIGGQKMADDKIRKKMGYSSQAKVPAGTNEATDDDYHKTLGPTKNSDEGIAALKKKHGMSHTKAVATMKRLMGEGKVDEISMGKMQAYGKAAAKDIDQKRNKVKAALDQPASVKHAKAGMKAMQGLTKRSKGSDMYVNKMTGRSKVKPSLESIMKIIKK